MGSSSFGVLYIMPNTIVYGIEMPTIGESENNWGFILENTTFAEFDKYLRDNPSQFLIVNGGADGSAPETSGYLRISGGTSLVSHWQIEHSTSGSLDFIEYDGSNTNTRLSIASGGGLWPYDSSGESYTKGGIYIPVQDPDAVGDWISSSTTSWTDVDVSDDGVPSVAVAAKIKSVIASSVGSLTLRVRINGETTSDNGDLAGPNEAAGAATTVTEWTIGIDSSGIFEAKFDTSFTNVANEVYVMGYFI
jgi:hypothetical protein